MLLSYTLQTLLVVPLYENQRTNHADNVIDSIIDAFENSSNMASVGSVAYNNMACVMVLNDSGNKLYAVDNIGDSCVLSSDSIISYDLNESFEALRSEEKPIIREVIHYAQQDRSSLLVGRKVKANLFTYYVFVNVLIMPVSSTIAILQNLLIVASMVVIGVAFLISWYFSAAIARPITLMKDGAIQLAGGNYQTQFSGHGYSEVESLANTLNLATDRLSRYDEMRNELFSNVSHDLKTPITNISLYAELLDEVAKNDPIKQQEYLEVIQKEVRYLDNLVKDMEQASASPNEIEMTMFSLSDLLNNIVKTFVQGNNDENLYFEYTIAENIHVKGDPLKIEQVIRNFILNAIKYSNNPKNLVKINLKRLRATKALVEVIDQGDGISPDDLPYVWDRYYRGSSHFHRQKSGSGLGLSIAKSILEQHNLSYGVDSKSGLGSRFYFEIKVKNGHNS